MRTGTPAPQATGTSAITSPDWRPRVTAVEGRFVEASNATLLGETADGERVIYKPIAGVRPLWDFEAASLAMREVWTFRIDRVLGFGVVPETAMGDGPYGPGAVQRHVEGRADETVVELINRADAALWPLAILDVIVNNADRKVGHLLRDADGKVWGIDHGLTFHQDDKLRTVLWSFAGMAISGAHLDALRHLGDASAGPLGDRFASDLKPQERDALQHRISALIVAGRHPDPPEDRPAIPWPPY